MTIRYRVEENALTSPKTYKATPEPNDILDIYDISRAIHVTQPNITEATAITVLNALVSEVMYQLLQGNNITIRNFVSFRTTIPGRLDNATDPLPTEPGDISAVIASRFRRRLREMATVERLDYYEKKPSILQARDTNYGINSLLRNDFSMSLYGANLEFDNTDTAQGVFIQKLDGSEQRQDNIAINSNSNILFVPSYGFTGDDGERFIIVRTKYTDNGRIRTSIKKKVRAITFLLLAFGGTEPILRVNGSENIRIKTAPSMTGQRWRFSAELTSSNDIKFQVARFNNDTGEVTDFSNRYTITENGEFILFIAAGEFRFNVTDIEGLRYDLENNQRYIVDVAEVALLGS